MKKKDATEIVYDVKTWKNGISDLRFNPDFRQDFKFAVIVGGDVVGFVVRRRQRRTRHVGDGHRRSVRRKQNVLEETNETYLSILMIFVGK